MAREPRSDGSDTATRARSASLGARLAGQERRLRLLLAHLAGPAVRRRVDLDDLLQETWLRALSSPGSLPAAEPGEAALGRLLARIARHVVIDVARAARTAGRDGAEVRLAPSTWSHASRPGVEPAAVTAGPVTRAAGGEDVARLIAAFEALAPEHRRVLGLRQFQGLSARETAGRMGRSETAVHSLYRRALAAWDQAR